VCLCLCVSASVNHPGIEWIPSSSYCWTLLKSIRERENKEKERKREQGFLVPLCAKIKSVGNNCILILGGPTGRTRTDENTNNEDNDDDDTESPSKSRMTRRISIIMTSKNAMALLGRLSAQLQKQQQQQQHQIRFLQQQRSVSSFLLSTCSMSSLGRESCRYNNNNNNKVVNVDNVNNVNNVNTVTSDHIRFMSTEMPPLFASTATTTTTATSTYNQSIHQPFPSIVIGPQNYIQPQGSFAEAQAQVRQKMFIFKKEALVYWKQMMGKEMGRERKFV
jgi:hypothetical protein